MCVPNSSSVQVAGQAGDRCPQLKGRGCGRLWSVGRAAARGRAGCRRWGWVLRPGPRGRRGRCTALRGVGGAGTAFGGRRWWIWEWRSGEDRTGWDRSASVNTGWRIRMQIHNPLESAGRRRWSSSRAQRHACVPAERCCCGRQGSARSMREVISAVTVHAKMIFNCASQ